MIGLFCFDLAVLASPFKSKMRLEAENAVLRHQLIVLRRKLRGRVQLANSDRWFFVQLYHWFPLILQVLTIIRPETLIRWHRSGFRCYWRWKSQSYVVRLDRRDLVWINVTRNPTAEWVARQITEAFPWDGAPGYMIRDRDRIYGTIVTRRLRAMGIRDKRDYSVVLLSGYAGQVRELQDMVSANRDKFDKLHVDCATVD